MATKEKNAVVDTSLYRKALASMDKEYFGKVFNRLYEEWSKDKRGQKGSNAALGREIPKTHTPSHPALSGQIIADWRNGKYKPKKLNHFIDICQFFRVSPELFAPGFTYLFPEYSAEEIKQLYKKCLEKGIDPGMLSFLKNTFSDIPHKMHVDFTSFSKTGRASAPNGLSVISLDKGKMSYFLDDDDLDFVSGLQEIVKKAVIDKFIEYETDYVELASNIDITIPLDPQKKQQLNFEAHVQNIIRDCPHLKPDDIIKKCEGKYNRKYKRKSLTDLLDQD